ncbi:MAG: tyrosine-type recombinase/integrase [Clostridiales bacterium]|nr:tyrosine-type recombinase/integrase [Clostridiales bacterium]
MEQAFEVYMNEIGLAPHTIRSYLYSEKQFKSRYTTVNRKNLRDYKTFLIDHYQPQTVNLRIRGINCYLESQKMEKLKLTSIKYQQKPFVENVISEADYLFFKNCLKRDNEMLWYFVVRFLTATGVRVSELVKIKAEHVEKGHFDLYSKGGKLRRIYFPASLRREALQWMKEIGRDSGYLFLNRSGKPLSERGVSERLKFHGKRYGLDEAVLHPHSFRHRFAKSFLERYNDIALLADLMGHDSIETTRIYLRKTSTEQQELIDKIVDW